MNSPFCSGPLIIELNTHLVKVKLSLMAVLYNNLTNPGIAQYAVLLLHSVDPHPGPPRNHRHRVSRVFPMH